jgi:RNA polymerase sigma factor (sigma-70 family)
VRQTTNKAATHEKRLEDVVLVVFDQQRRRLGGFFSRGAGPTEDLLQDTLLRAWDHRRSLDGDGSATNEELHERARRYLWRIARNLVIDDLRWRRRHRTTPGQLESTILDPAQEIEHNDCVRVLRETVARLANARVRRCVALWLEGRDPDDIARQLGLGAGQVRGLLQRGRAEVMRKAAARLDARRPLPDARTREAIDTARQGARERWASASRSSAIGRTSFP